MGSVRVYITIDKDLLDQLKNHSFNKYEEKQSRQIVNTLKAYQDACLIISKK